MLARVGGVKVVTRYLSPGEFDVAKERLKNKRIALVAAARLCNLDLSEFARSAPANDKWLGLALPAASGAALLVVHIATVFERKLNGEDEDE